MRLWNKSKRPLPTGQVQAAAAARAAAPSLVTTVDKLQTKAQATRKRAKTMLRRRRAVRRTLPAVLATVVYLVVAFFMFRIAGDAGPGRANMTLRYTQPLAPQQVDAAKFATGNPDVETEFSAVYWHQGPPEKIETERVSAETPVLYVDGDAGSVLKVEFVDGSYPAALEDRGLALSEGLAWQLMGGTTGVVGNTIKWHGQEYTVRGVFAGKELLMLAQVDAAEAPIEGFTGVELLGNPQGDPETAAKDFLQKAGLDTPPVMMSVRTVPGIISLMVWMPVWVLVAWFLLRALRLLRHVAAWKRQLVWFCLLLAAAILIPRALEQLPSWMIPTRWSDMEHWSDFMLQVSARINQWLGLLPSLADVQLKKQLIVQAALLLPALFSMTAMIRYWSAHMRRLDTGLRLRLAAGRAQEKAREIAAETPDGDQQADEMPRLLAPGGAEGEQAVPD